jgi:uncharacterized protein
VSPLTWSRFSASGNAVDAGARRRVSLARVDEPRGQPVTVTIARRVAPGREGEFERWATRLTEAAARFPGFLGAGLLRPGPDGQDWHVVYRFDTADHLAAWERSDARATILADGRDIMETTGSQRVSGLETWFSLPHRAVRVPPKWKMFLVSGAATYALQVVVNVGLDRLAGSWPLAVRLAVFVALVTAGMTWLLMPRLANLFARWLYPPL